MKTIKLISLLLTLFVIQSCKEEPPMKLGDNYFLTFDGSWGHTIILDSTNAIIIQQQIVAWNFDSIFIIAKQKPFNELFDSIRMKHPNTPLSYREKLYYETEVYNYWIIDKRKELVFNSEEKKGWYTNAVNGPFTYEEYWEKRREFNVPDSLKLYEAERGSFPGLLEYWIYLLTNKARETVVD
jgi:hypothetical protein